MSRNLPSMFGQFTKPIPAPYAVGDTIICLCMKHTELTDVGPKDLTLIELAVTEHIDQTSDEGGTHHQYFLSCPDGGTWYNPQSEDYSVFLRSVGLGNYKGWIQAHCVIHVLDIFQKQLGDLTDVQAAEVAKTYVVAIWEKFNELFPGKQLSLSSDGKYSVSEKPNT